MQFNINIHEETKTKYPYNILDLSEKYRKPFKKLKMIDKRRRMAQLKKT